jgi:hypothetical protein
MMRQLAFVLLACLLLVGTIARADAAAHDWLVVSDVHFDPFADPHIVDRLAGAPATRWRAIFSAGGPAPFANYGSDTNFALLESSLDAMRNAESDPPVVIVSGDFLAHGFRDKFNRSAHNHDDAHYDSFVDETIRFLAIEFRTAFPRARLLPVIGNNDGYCGDYQSTPSSPFLATVASAWGASVGADDPNAFAAQFATGGYYTVPLPAGDAQAVVLNNVFWSSRYQNACGDKTSDPGGDELNWLNLTLKSIGSKNIWVIAHIPPGIDTYSSLQANTEAPISFLEPRFNDAMLNALLSTTPHTVMAIAGHTHMNSYRIVGPDPSRPFTPVLVVPSVSPVYANNPSFTVLRVNDSDASVEDAQFFVLDDLTALAKNGHLTAHWRREYDFDSVYGRGSIDAGHLAGVQRAIFDDDRIRRRFQQYYDGSSGRAPITDQTWHSYWCANVALTVTAYQACAAPQIQRQLPPHPPEPPTASPTPTPAPSP